LFLLPLAPASLTKQTCHGKSAEVVLDETQLDHVRQKKQKARKESGDFSEGGDDGEADI
jgi:hypothetical protein